MEHRRLWVSSALAGYTPFPHVAQVITVERERTILTTGKTSSERSYWITTATSDRLLPAQILGMVRGHWGIENRIHWVRDVTYDEDRSQIRERNGPRMMACLRNFSISILRILGMKNIASTHRDLSAKPHRCLRLLGF